MQMTQTLWQKVKRTTEPLDESERGVIIYMWNLKNRTNELICKTEIESWI